MYALPSGTGCPPRIHKPRNMSPIVVCTDINVVLTRGEIYLLFFFIPVGSTLTDDLKVKLFEQKESQHGRQFFKKGPIKTKCFVCLN